MKMSRNLTKISFSWNKWLVLYGICYPLICFYEPVAPLLYYVCALALLCVQCSVAQARLSKHQLKVSMANVAQKIRDCTAVESHSNKSFWAVGELDNSGFFEALERDRAKAQEDESLRRAFYEAYRAELKSETVAAKKLSSLPGFGYRDLARVNLTGNGYGGVSAQQATDGLGNITQAGLTTANQVDMSVWSATNNVAESSSGRSHYDFCRRN